MKSDENVVFDYLYSVETRRRKYYEGVPQKVENLWFKNFSSHPRRRSEQTCTIRTGLFQIQFRLEFFYKRRPIPSTEWFCKRADKESNISSRSLVSFWTTRNVSRLHRLRRSVCRPRWSEIAFFNRKYRQRVLSLGTCGGTGRPWMVKGNKSLH